MKIDELVEKLNELKSLRAKKQSDGILIYSKQSIGYDFFFSLGYKSKSLTDVVFDWRCLDGVKPADLHKALNLVDCFLHTPINERFPEKKYRLRWIDDPNGDKNYLFIEENYLWRFWQTGDKSATFTESALDQLKRDNPRLAPAIDAMKEPVEE